MREKWERLANVLLVCAALTVAGVLVRRELFAPQVAQAASSRPTLVEEWRDFRSSGRLVGSAQAPVTIVEFVDLQCPFCRTFHQTLSRALEKHGDKVAYLFIHLPIPAHPYAFPAARAAECAHAQGSFKPFLDAVFEQQDSLGKKSWSSYAHKAGIGDSIGFARCVRDTTALPMVDAGVALASEQSIRATPTILVNGWKFHGALTEGQLDRAIERLLDGKNPQ